MKRDPESQRAGGEDEDEDDIVFCFFNSFNLLKLLFGPIRLELDQFSAQMVDSRFESWHFWKLVHGLRTGVGDHSPRAQGAVRNCALKKSLVLADLVKDVPQTPDPLILADSLKHIFNVA